MLDAGGGVIDRGSVGDVSEGGGGASGNHANAIHRRRDGVFWAAVLEGDVWRWRRKKRSQPVSTILGHTTAGASPNCFPRQRLPGHQPRHKGGLPWRLRGMRSLTVFSLVSSAPDSFTKHLHHGKGQAWDHPSG